MHRLPSARALFRDSSYRSTEPRERVSALRVTIASRQRTAQEGGHNLLGSVRVPTSRSAAAQLVGDWGLASSMVAGAVLVGRLIRRFPYLLPNRLPGLVLHEIGPGLLLVLAIGAALATTRGTGQRAATRFIVLFLCAAIVGVGSLSYEFGSVLAPEWG